MGKGTRKRQDRLEAIVKELEIERSLLRAICAKFVLKCGCQLEMDSGKICMECRFFITGYGFQQDMTKALRAATDFDAQMAHHAEGAHPRGISECKECGWSKALYQRVTTEVLEREAAQFEARRVSPPTSGPDRPD